MLIGATAATADEAVDEVCVRARFADVGIDDGGANVAALLSDCCASVVRFEVEAVVDEAALEMAE